MESCYLALLGQGACVCVCVCVHPCLPVCVRVRVGVGVRVCVRACIWANKYVFVSDIQYLHVLTECVFVSERFKNTYIYTHCTCQLNPNISFKADVGLPRQTPVIFLGWDFFSLFLLRLYCLWAFSLLSKRLTHLRLPRWTPAAWLASYVYMEMMSHRENPGRQFFFSSKCLSLVQVCGSTLTHAARGHEKNTPQTRMDVRERWEENMVTWRTSKGHFE